MTSLRDRLGTYKDPFFAYLKTYRIAIPVQIIYAVFCVTLAVIQMSGTPILGNSLNDFAQYWYAAKILVGLDPAKIYDPALFASLNTFPFRYFPTVLLVIFYPLAQLPLVPAFVLFSCITLVVNIVNIYLVLVIIRKTAKTPAQGLVEMCVAAFFILPFNIDFYTQGQISPIVTLPLLISLYFFLEKRETLGSLFLGVSLFVKPMTFLQIVFVLFAALSAKDIKLAIKRAACIALPLVPDLL